MNPRLQGKLLEELFGFVNGNSQLWIATHAIGMMRKALQLHEEYAEQVVFLDFGDRDFDNLKVVEPTNPDRRFWERTHEVALDDLAALIVPSQIVICEGSHGDDGFDAKCYNQIFSAEFPDTKFISGGGKKELLNYISVVSAVAKGVKVFGIRDRDQATPGEIAQFQQRGIRVLQRGQIEDYLLDNSILRALCKRNRLESYEEKVGELVELRDKSPHIKAAADQIRKKVSAWEVNGAGETREGFLRDTLARLIKPGMPIYDELKKIIFGSDTADA